jgi:hypothetical protein
MKNIQHRTSNIEHPVTGRFSIAVLFSSLALILVGCGTVKATNEVQVASEPVSKPAKIYVTNFELRAANIKHKDGILPVPIENSGPLPIALPGLSKSPEARARQLVELMSESITKNLNKAGFTATRLALGASMPTDGWLIRGVFTEVQEGNRLQRAMIGFGQGATDLQVVTKTDNLAEGTLSPLYRMETDASSGKTPGAAPTLVLGPYGAAARLVMAGEDLERSVKQTATTIVEGVTKQVPAAK